MDQRCDPGYFHPETWFHLGSTSNIMHPTFLPTYFEVHHLPEHRDDHLFYGRTPYERFQPHPVGNLDLYFYTPHMPQASGSDALYYRSTDHLTPGNNYRYVGVFADDYGMCGHSMDYNGGSYKRKCDEGIPVNFQHVSSSSLVNHLDTWQHSDRATASYPIGNLDLNFYTPHMPQASGSDALYYHSTDHLTPGNNYRYVEVFADEYGMRGHSMDYNGGSYERKYDEGIPVNFQHVSSSSLVNQLDTWQHSDRATASYPIGNLDLNFYTPHVPQASGSDALYYRSTDHLTPGNNYRYVGVFADEYGMRGHSMDYNEGSNKRKYDEGIPVNFQHVSSSSLVNHLDTWQHTDRATASYPMPHQYAGYASSSSSHREVGSSVRNRSSAHGVEPVMADNYNRMNYMDQPFAPSGAVWFDRQTGTNCRDRVTSSAWTPVPNLPYSHGNNIIGGSMETLDMTPPWYHETANNRTSASYIPHSPINFRHHHEYDVLPPVAHVPGSRGRNSNFIPPAAVDSHRIPTNYVSRSTWDEMNVTALRRPVSNPHLRFMPYETAILDISHYYDMEDSADPHRDLRLDIEHMSYEELLALEEHIGSVNTGLSEEKINCQLKTRTYLSSETHTESEQDSDPCIICQEEYKNQEKIGILKCGHEYHVDCLTKWLLEKNACPICKSEGVD